ncbi:MAG: hypothetical protein LBV55_02910 [Acholeplasmatales bacterium]|jgi:putative aldouronate transport system substrate-binding protein|nr:hypothetical protein [Acholeplasmatales bacterium]
MKKLLLSLFLVLGFVVLVGCKKQEPPKPPVVDDTIYDIPEGLEPTSLNVAINYKLNTHGVALSSISWQLDSPYISTVNGKTYSKGDLLPVWEHISTAINATLVDVATASDADTASQWTRLVNSNFEGVDLVNGTGPNIAEQGVLGKFVDLSQYITESNEFGQVVMPNFKKFLDDNPGYRSSVTSYNQGIYFTPYFDGLNEFEQINLMRIDWVKDILDVENPTFDTTPAFKPTAYTTRVVPTPINTVIKVATSSTTTRNVTKAYTTNILDALQSATTGADAANILRTHIQTTYGQQGYAKLSDVYVGTDAAYDTDELVALYYVIKSNPHYLTREHAGGPKDAVEVIFPRESAGNRVRNIVRSLENWGIKGVASKLDYLYFDAQGRLQDARRDAKTQAGIDGLNGLYQDGVIVNNLSGGGAWAQNLLTQSIGFTEYDYNASQTPIAWINQARQVDPTFEWQSVLPPVNNWKGDGEYFHFTEFVRNGKSEAWGIPANISTNKVKLRRALILADQLYNMNKRDSLGTVNLYGPAAWGDEKITDSPSLGVPIFRLNTAALTELNDPLLGEGNMINYLRRYLGATMPIGHIRDMGLELQTLSGEGEAGYNRVTTAFQAGTFRLGGVYKIEGDPAASLWYKVAGVYYAILPSSASYIAANFGPIVDVFKDSNYANLISNPVDWTAFNAAYTSELYNNYISAYRIADALANA